jgi:hypothetical protein
MRVLRGMVMVAVLGCSVRPGDANDIVLGSDATDTVNVEINKKSANPSKHRIEFSLKDTAIDLGPPLSYVPITNGATAMVFSATDCECIVMGQAPWTTPGWRTNRSGTTYNYSRSYSWKDDATKSSAQVKDGRIKFKSGKGVITYGLDGTPQGEVEVQVDFPSSGNRYCTRFAAPPRPSYDTATWYRSKAFDTGTASCSAVPSFCGPCACDAAVGGFCWLRGVQGASCDETCAAAGKTCDAATTTYVGSGGTTSNCAAVWEAIQPLRAGLAPDDFGCGPGTAIGCYLFNQLDYYARCTSSPTTCAASTPGVNRACACQ